jgi:hypothetical protein
VSERKEFVTHKNDKPERSESMQEVRAWEVRAWEVRPYCRLGVLMIGFCATAAACRARLSAIVSTCWPTHWRRRLGLTSELTRNFACTSAVARIPN